VLPTVAASSNNGNTSSRESDLTQHGLAEAVVEAPTKPSNCLTFIKKTGYLNRLSTCVG